MDDHYLAIMKRLDLLESGVKQIAAFLRTKSSTLGETFPEQQHRKAQEVVDGHKPDRRFVDGQWQD